jgi:hypothetical protein
MNLNDIANGRWIEEMEAKGQESLVSGVALPKCNREYPEIFHWVELAINVNRVIAEEQS